MDEFSLIQKIIIWAVPVIFAITVHEVAHGWVALKLGDRTAQMMGRLTLNPIKHIDPVGTVIMPGLMLILQFPFIFGWAKPVPVTYQNLRNRKSSVALVAVAGPMANLVMAVLWALIVKLGMMLHVSGTGIGEPMVLMGMAGVLINTMLMMLNLLPIPPLDGGRIVMSLLPGPLAWKLSRLEPYGFIILVGLLYLGVISYVLMPMMRGFINVLELLFNLPNII